MCRGWHGEFGWSSDANYRVVAQWRSRTADFFVCRPKGVDQTVAVKVIVRGSTIEPEEQAAALKELGRMHGGALGSVARPPRVFAWSANPAAVALEYIPGKDLPAVVSEALKCGGGETLHDPLYVCGATLASWHRWLPLTEGPHSHEGRLSQALKCLRRAAFRQWISLESPSEQHVNPTLVRRYRDFGIYNFRISTSGEVTVVDPPRMTVELDLPYRDIAWFLSTMDAVASKSVIKSARSGVLRLRQYDALRRGWVHAFLAGYENGSQHALKRWDLSAIAVLESLFLSGRFVRSLRQRRLPSAVMYAQLILRARDRANQGPWSVGEITDQ
jgi:hypothetical protein